VHQNAALLCGRPNRPHYWTCQFVVLSVHSFVCPGLLTQRQKKRSKTEICVNVPRDRSNRSANFHLKRSKITGRRNTQEMTRGSSTCIRIRLADRARWLTRSGGFSVHCALGRLSLVTSPTTCLAADLSVLLAPTVWQSRRLS